MGTNATRGTTTAKGLYENFIFKHNHFAFGGVKASSTFVLGLSTSTSGSKRRVPPPRGSLLAARPWAIPSGSSSCSLVSLTRRHLVPRFAASGPGFRLGPLSLLRWVLHPSPVRLSARRISIRAAGRVSRSRSSTTSQSLLDMPSLFPGPFGFSTCPGAAGCVFLAALKFDVWNRILYVFLSAYKFRGVFSFRGVRTGFPGRDFRYLQGSHVQGVLVPQVCGAGSPVVRPCVVVFQNFEELVPLCVVRQPSSGNLGFLCFPPVP